MACPRSNSGPGSWNSAEYWSTPGPIQRPFPETFGGQGNHGGNVAAFEELTTADPSLQIKAGVQWGLFGAAVLQLGTARNHDAFLPGIITLEVPGCFAMTETGHGSDVQSIATTATYDPASETFIIHTPFRGAWKDYIGNAALHGRAAVVFAQLITQGVPHGMHAFYVPIRDDSGAFLPGVGDDDGQKGGLNGVDNGRPHFEQMHVPERTCSTGTVTLPPTARTPPRSGHLAGGSSRCSAPLCKAVFRSTALPLSRRSSH